MVYSIEEHKHRYAAWAASRAASTKTCRFNVRRGKDIIEALGLNALLLNPDLLPTPSEIDTRHREWRKAAIKAATRMDLPGFGHGVAAKLINVYLKGAFVCAGHHTHNNVAALHPPIDSLLLDELYKNNVGSLRGKWAEARKVGWSKFNSEQYESVISAIKSALAGAPLWQVESYWRGYQ